MSDTGAARSTEPSRERPRYAARLPRFRRVEDTGDRAVVCVFELQPATKTYAVTGIHHDRLTITVSCPQDSDLTEPTLPRG